MKSMLAETATMLGKKTSITMGPGCARFADQNVDNAPFVLFMAARLLEQVEIADYILHQLTPGEEVVIVDEFEGLSYCFYVDDNEIEVQGIYTKPRYAFRRQRRCPCLFFEKLARRFQVVPDCYGARLNGAMVTA